MAEHQKLSSSSQPSSQNTAQNPRSSTSPLPDLAQGHHHPSIAGVGKDSEDDDLVYTLFRRQVRDHQGGDGGSGSRSPPLQSAGKPGTTSRPLSPDPKASTPSTSPPPSSGASSSPWDSCAAHSASDNTRPKPRGAQFHQPGCSTSMQAPGCSTSMRAPGCSTNLKTPAYSKLQAPVCAEEIVELPTQPSPADDSPQSEAEGEATPYRRGRERRGEEVTHIPNTNFAIACMVTLCFNLPLGVVAVYLSLTAARAFRDGQAKQGHKRSRWSIVCSLLGIAFTTVLVSSIVLYIAMQGQRRISQYRAYSVKAGLSL
ncbi:hypothetical protein ACOMHN_041362 [Nucella lapillus]